MADLRARLRAISTSRAPAEKRGGLVEREWRTAADRRLYDLSPPALRRIGWTHGAFDPAQCLFLDTETTGLSGGAGTVAFLVGAGYIEEGEFVVRQFLMRDYADEPILLSRLAELFRNHSCFVTYNGRTFDVPLLETRFTMNRMRDVWREAWQLDLLYPTRAVWKMRIGSCTLGNVEREILSSPRSEDIPGNEVPDRYFAFLKTGDFALLEPVIDHNRQDVATLATLLVKLCGVYADPASQPRRDVFSLGKVLERQGELGGARELYRLSAVPPASAFTRRTDPLSAQAGWRLYLLLRREGNAAAMRDQLEILIRRGQSAARAYVELSKLYEHKLRDIPRALSAANNALRSPGIHEIDNIARRISRLEKKAGANGGRI